MAGQIVRPLKPFLLELAGGLRRVGLITPGVANGNPASKLAEEKAVGGPHHPDRWRPYNGKRGMEGELQ